MLTFFVAFCEAFATHKARRKFEIKGWQNFVKYGLLMLIDFSFETYAVLKILEGIR